MQGSTQRSRGPTGGLAGRQWLTILAVLMAIAINALSNFFPPAGQNIGEVSNTTLGGVLLTPAGYAFAIWGLIYLGLMTYSIYQALPAQRNVKAIARVSWALIGACLLQTLWVYAFLVSNFWLSVVLMLGILACLVVGYLGSRSVAPTRKVRWLLQAPISLYFGWITVAAVVNIAGALFVSVFSAAEPTVTVVTVGCTVVMMVVSTGIAATVALRYGDATYPTVSVWALSAIAVRQASVPLIAYVGMALAVGLSIVIVRILTTGQGRMPKAF